MVFRRVSGALNLAVGFNPRDSRHNVPASRQRRVNSIVADATWKNNLAYRGLKPTAKFRCRYAAELIKAVMLWAMVIGLNASLSIHIVGQDLGAVREFIQSTNSSNAAQKLLREGRELVSDRKWDAATTKFNDLIRAYPRDKNLDAALYWMAFCMKQQGRLQESDQILERLIREYPRSGWGDDARALRLELAGALGNLDAARDVLERDREAKDRSREAKDRSRESKVRSREGKERSRAVKEISGSLHESDQNSLRAEDPEEALRLIALQSLFQADPERAMSVAAGFLGADSKTSPAIQEAALGLIARHGGEKAWPALLDTARNQSLAEKVREQAIYWIAHRNGSEATDILVRLYDEQKEVELKEKILYWLGQRGGKSGLQKLFAVARSDSPQNLRERAIYYLGQSKDPEAIKLLEQIIK